MYALRAASERVIDMDQLTPAVEELEVLVEGTALSEELQAALNSAPSMQS